jgi:hypothetical protein
MEDLGVYFFLHVEYKTFCADGKSAAHKNSVKINTGEEKGNGGTVVWSLPVGWNAGKWVFVIY